MEISCNFLSGSATIVARVLEPLAFQWGAVLLMVVLVVLGNEIETDRNTMTLSFCMSQSDERRSNDVGTLFVVKEV